MCKGWQDGDYEVREYAGMTRGALKMDKCLAPILDALNAAGIRTLASCCGHGIRPGCISLADGREFIVAPNYETARTAERAFPPLNVVTPPADPAPATPHRYPHCVKCRKVLEDCGCDGYQGSFIPDAATPEQGKVDLSNHHNALKCPYCNPRGLVFAEPPPSPQSLADVPRYKLKAINGVAGTECHNDGTLFDKTDIEALVQRLEEDRAHAMFDADERDALVARAEQAEASLAQARNDLIVCHGFGDWDHKLQRERDAAEASLQTLNEAVREALHASGYATISEFIDATLDAFNRLTAENHGLRAFVQHKPFCPRATFSVKHRTWCQKWTGFRENMSLDNSKTCNCPVANPPACHPDCGLAVLLTEGT